MMESEKSESETITIKPLKVVKIIVVDEEDYNSLLARSEKAEEELAAMRIVLTEIRDIARTGLAPSGMTEEYWKQHKLNRIASMASHSLKAVKDE